MASRQWAWKLAQLTAGRCAQCGHEPLVSVTLGANCLRKSRRYAATRGHLPSAEGRRGRPRLAITSPTPKKARR